LKGLQGSLEVEVFVRDLLLFSRCGVYEEERKLGGRFLVSIRVGCEDFVDYSYLVELAKETAERRTYETMESLGKSILEEIISKCGVNWVIIEIEKLNVPLKDCLKTAGVRLEWRKRKKR
jgi:dihydroneopterin aldolase